MHTNREPSGPQPISARAFALLKDSSGIVDTESETRIPRPIFGKESLLNGIEILNAIGVEIDQPRLKECHKTERPILNC
jgi:hypothetical protein